MVGSSQATADAVVRVSPSLALAAGSTAENGRIPLKGTTSGHLSRQWTNKEVSLQSFESCGKSWVDSHILSSCSLTQCACLCVHAERASSSLLAL